MSKRRSARNLCRRDILSALGAGALAAPFVPLSNRELRAQDSGFPRRLVIVYVPNWTTDAHTLCTGTGTDYELAEGFASFQRHKSMISIVDGIDNQAVYSDPPARGHQGTLTVLTGAPPLPGNINVEGNGLPTGWASGPSVDQYIADRLDGETPFRSLELGVAAGAGSVSHRTRISYRGADQPVPPDNQVEGVFDRLFGTLDPQSTERTFRNELRLRTAAIAQEHTRDLMGRLPSEDRFKLQAHLEHLDAIERRIRGAGANCSAPNRTPRRCLHVVEKHATARASCKPICLPPRSRVTSPALRPCSTESKREARASIGCSTIRRTTTAFRTPAAERANSTTTPAVARGTRNSSRVCSTNSRQSPKAAAPSSTTAPSYSRPPWAIPKDTPTIRFQLFSPAEAEAFSDPDAA